MHTSKNIFVLLLMLFASTALIGCDSNDDEGDAGDVERFLGTWGIVSAADQNGTRDQTAVFSALGTLSLALNEDGTYSLLFQDLDPETDDVPVVGNYTVNEASTTLVLVVQLEGLPQVNLPLEYNFVSDTEVEFTADGLTLGLLLGTSLEEGVVLVAEKQ